MKLNFTLKKMCNSVRNTIFAQLIDLQFIVLQTMKQVFDYLENADFAATVCDSEGIVVYQNAISRNNDGDVVGKNLYKCHGSKSGEKNSHMIETGHSNT